MAQLANTWTTYPNPAVQRDALGEIILKTPEYQATHYHQRADGWQLTNEKDGTLAKCDEFGRLWTRSYSLSIVWRGPWGANTINAKVNVHEFGPLVCLCFEGARYGSSGAVAAAIGNPTCPLPPSLRPYGAEVTGSMEAINENLAVPGFFRIFGDGAIQIRQAGLADFTIGAAGEDAGFQRFSVMYDRRPPA